MTKSDTNKAIASAVEKKVGEKMEAMEKEKISGNETEAYIMSLFQKFATAGNTKKVKISDVTTSEPTPAPPPPPTPTLKSIIERAKNGSQNI